MLSGEGPTPASARIVLPAGTGGPDELVEFNKGLPVGGLGQEGDGDPDDGRRRDRDEEGDVGGHGMPDFPAMKKMTAIRKELDMAAISLQALTRHQNQRRR